MEKDTLGSHLKKKGMRCLLRRNQPDRRLNNKPRDAINEATERDSIAVPMEKEKSDDTKLKAVKAKVNFRNTES